MVDGTTLDPACFSRGGKPLTMRTDIPPSQWRYETNQRGEVFVNCMIDAEGRVHMVDRAIADHLKSARPA
mgnify:CR=1 FL=1